MQRKLSNDAFAFYWSMGSDRSYQDVAKKYSVSKRAVTKLATREKWQERIRELEKQAHDNLEKKMLESLEQMNERHIKICKLIQRKAFEALKSMPVTAAMDAVRALDMSIKQERLIRGEPTERTANVEEIIKKEYER